MDWLIDWFQWIPPIYIRWDPGSAFPTDVPAEKGFFLNSAIRVKQSEFQVKPRADFPKQRTQGVTPRAALRVCAAALGTPSSPTHRHTHLHHHTLGTNYKFQNKYLFIYYKFQNKYLFQNTPRSSYYVKLHAFDEEQGWGTTKPRSGIYLGLSEFKSVS